MFPRRRFLHRWLLGTGLGVCGYATPRLLAQEPTPMYFCPMDADVRTSQPGKCPRCGMKLETGLPQFAEHGMQLTLSPAKPQVGRPVRLTFRVLTPTRVNDGKPVTRFRQLHERLFHLFVVGQTRFAHEHPEMAEDGSFHLEFTPTEPGLHRLFADFYPEGGMPQFVPASVWVGGARRVRTTVLPSNTEVRLETNPGQVLAGQRNLLRFQLSPADKMEPWLGAAGHLFVVTKDLEDAQHVHPAWTNLEGEPGMLPFEIVLPRQGEYRVYLQFQRDGLLHTRQFAITATKL